MKHEPILILMFGHDQNLLETKQWVLQSRGYRVFLASSLSGITDVPRAKPISLLLLCNPLRPGEREAVIALATSRWPELQHLSLPAESRRAPNGILGQLLHTMDGSTALLARVNEIVRGENIPEQARAS
jgi:hypothetical protein